MSRRQSQRPITRLRILVQALPHMQRYDRGSVVIMVWRGTHGRPRMAAKDFARGCGAAGAVRASNRFVVHRWRAADRGACWKSSRDQVRNSGLVCGVTDEATDRDRGKWCSPRSINKQIVGLDLRTGRGASIGMCGKDGNMGAGEENLPEP